MTKYVIEFDTGSWVLRSFGRYETMASTSSIEAIRTQAFGILRASAPCTLKVLREPLEVWQLRAGHGEWEQVVP